MPRFPGPCRRVATPSSWVNLTARATSPARPPSASSASWCRPPNPLVLVVGFVHGPVERSLAWPRACDFSAAAALSCPFGTGGGATQRSSARSSRRTRPQQGERYGPDLRRRGDLARQARALAAMAQRRRAARSQQAPGGGRSAELSARPPSSLSRGSPRWRAPPARTPWLRAPGSTLPSAPPRQHRAVRNRPAIIGSDDASAM